MLKVAIADDEKMIREGLEMTFPWEEEGFEVVGTCKNGKEALGIAAQHRPDIFLMDINMPFMNGLEVIEALNAFNPDTKYIIITGYDDFKYAQQAIRLGVYDFILKPIDEDKLWKMLLDLKLTLISEEVISEKQDYITNKMQEHFDDMQKGFIYNLVIKGFDTEEAINNEMKHLSLKFGDRTGLLLLENQGNVGTGKWSDPLLFFSLSNILQEVAGQAGSVISIGRDSGNRLFALMEIKDPSAWADLPEAIEAAVLEYLEHKVCVNTGEPGDSLMSCHKLYKKLAAEMKCHYSDCVIQAKRMIEADFSNPELDLNVIAEEAAVSPSYLSRTIKKELGISFKEYLIRLRMEKAKGLIAHTDMRFNEIAENVGYANQHYFTRAFKKATGMSPSQFRADGRQHRPGVT